MRRQGDRDRPPGWPGRDGRLACEYLTGPREFGGNLAIGQAERDNQPPIPRRGIPRRGIPRRDLPRRTW